MRSNRNTRYPVSCRVCVCVCLPLLALFLMSVIVVTYNTTVIIIIITVDIVYTLRKVCPNNGRTFVGVLSPISVLNNDYFIFCTLFDEHLLYFFLLWIRWQCQLTNFWIRVPINYLKDIIQYSHTLYLLFLIQLLHYYILYIAIVLYSYSL